MYCFGLQKYVIPAAPNDRIYPVALWEKQDLVLYFGDTLGPCSIQFDLRFF